MTVCLAACHPKYIQISATHILLKQTKINEPPGRWGFILFISEYEATLGTQTILGLWGSIKSESEVWLCNFLMRDFSSLGLSSLICKMDCSEDHIKSTEGVWHTTHVSKCWWLGGLG